MRRIYVVAISLALLVAPMAARPALAGADTPTWPANHQQILRYVIARALSQRGVPFVWGGGNATGPTRGTEPSPIGQEVTSISPGASTLSPQTNPLSPGAGAISPGAGTYNPSANTVGFDASGLIQYAYAGAGIKMPRSSGEQYKVGRKIPPAQARPGDLIFYGPEGTQSVAMYLGNGQMVEATEPAVTVSAARTAGMTPYLTRIIEY